MKQQRLEHLFNMKLSAGFVSIICVIVYTSFPHGHTLLATHPGFHPWPSLVPHTSFSFGIVQLKVTSCLLEVFQDYLSCSLGNKAHCPLPLIRWLIWYLYVAAV